MATSKRLLKLLADAKVLAREYYELTERPLGVTGEVAEYEAARILGVELSPARQAGYDAIRKTPEGDQLLQIKGRCILPGSKPSQRVGSLSLKKEWDAALLVLLNESYNPTEIYEADRSSVARALTTPGSRARNERGQLSVSQFKAIAQKIWPRSRT